MNSTLSDLKRFIFFDQNRFALLILWKVGLISQLNTEVLNVRWTKAEVYPYKVPVSTKDVQL